MLNQLVLVGRIANELHLKKESAELEVILEVKRNFKNDNGEYDIDYIKVNLTGEIARATHEHCAIGELVGVKGRVTCTDKDNLTISLVAEKVTFLSSKGLNESGY